MCLAFFLRVCEFQSTQCISMVTKHTNTETRRLSRILSLFYHVKFFPIWLSTESPQRECRVRGWCIWRTGIFLQGYSCQCTHVTYLTWVDSSEGWQGRGAAFVRVCKVQLGLAIQVLSGMLSSWILFRYPPLQFTSAPSLLPKECAFTEETKWGCAFIVGCIPTTCYIWFLGITALQAWQRRHFVRAVF